MKGADPMQPEQSGSKTPRKLRVLSGVQPSGRLHLGNWFGAIRQHIRLQQEGHTCYYFVANYHALTSLQDAAALEAATMHVVLSYLALGLDPESKSCNCGSLVSGWRTKSRPISPSIGLSAIAEVNSSSRRT